MVLFFRFTHLQKLYYLFDSKPQVNQVPSEENQYFHNFNPMEKLP